MTPVRVGLDATPLLGPLTGIGTYVDRLLAELPAGWPQDGYVATAFTWGGRRNLPEAVPAGVGVATRPAPARLLRLAWRRWDHPAVEALTGPLDVFHATNFVLPPTSRSAAVLTVHDLTYLRHPETVATASLAYRELVPRGVARADLVLTPSVAVAQQVSDAYAGAAGKVRVTPLGVDRAWFDAVPPDATWRGRLGVDRPYLLAVGTQEPRKNLAALVRAYRLLLAREADTPMLVIAGGEGWGPVLDAAGVPPERVVFTGYLPVADLRPLVAGARLLAFPSLDEGFGLPPLEALACGVPVVVNDLPVLREVLGDHVTYGDAEDRSAFADALQTALSRPASTPAERRAHAARYTWRRCAELTRAAYEEAHRART